MLNLVSTSADFSNSGDFDLPVATGALYFNFFRGGVGVVSRNLVKGRAKPTVIGTPAFGNGYAEFTGGNFPTVGNNLLTDIDEMANFTYLFAGRGADAAADAVYIGNYAGNNLAGGGASIFSTSTLLRGSAYLNNAGASATANADVVSPVRTDWTFGTLKYDGEKATTRDITRNLKTVSAPTTYPRAPTVNKLKVGSGYSSAYLGKCQIAFAAIYVGALSEEQEAMIYDRVRRVLLLDAIVV